FSGAILMDGQLNDPGPRNSSPTSFNLPDPGYSVNPPDFSGAFVTLPDGRKFPVVPTSNPNEFIWAGDPIATTDRKTKLSEERNIPSNGRISLDTKKLPGVKLKTHDAAVAVGYVSNVQAKQSNPLLSHLMVSSDSNDTYDGVMKGGDACLAGPLPWNWDCVVPRGENTPASMESSKMYRSSSGSGPPLAKNARLSENVALPMRSYTLPPHTSPTRESPWFVRTDKDRLLDTHG
ncbi:unnamed protein product, partial [Allacma fusca]